MDVSAEAPTVQITASPGDLYELYRGIGDTPGIRFVGLAGDGHLNRSMFGDLGAAVLAISSAGGLGVLGSTLVAVLRNRRSVIEVSVGDTTVRIDGTVDDVEQAVSAILDVLTRSVVNESRSDG